MDQIQMKKSGTFPPRSRVGDARPRRGRSGLRIARVFGIEIRLDISVLIIFVLVVYSLGAGLFPRWHPNWEPGLTWSTALAAGVLFFVSLLAHELSHSVVAQLRGIPVRGITLFVFGGVSELEREPNTPGTEFLVAIVGPLMSFALGILFSWLGIVLAGEGFADQAVQDAEAALSGLGPVSTLLLWLGPINLMLGLFNLVPGFPLDGGRVLRALLWGVTGNLERATWWASNTGRFFAWVLMSLGVLEALRGAVMQGIWLLLIGWFLNNAARSSYMQLLVRQAIEHLVVRNLMRTHFEVIHPDVPLQAFVDEHLLRSAQLAWPVVEDGQAIGLITFDDVRATSESSRAEQTVRDAMSAIDESLRPDIGGREALQALAKSEADPLPVLEHQQVVGLLHRSDILRWLAFHQLGSHT